MNSDEIAHTLEQILECAVLWNSEEPDKYLDEPKEWRDVIDLVKRLAYEYCS